MKKICSVEGTLINKNYYQSFFRYILKKQPVLICFVFYHLYILLLFNLRILKEEDYQYRYWKYISCIKDFELHIKEYGKKISNPLPLTDALYISCAPKIVNDYWFSDYSVLSVCGSKDLIEQFSTYLETEKISSYEAYGLNHKELCKNSEKEYLLEKGKCYPKTYLRILFPYIKSIILMFVFSVILGILILVMTPLVSDLNMIRALLENYKIVLLNVWPIFVFMVIVYSLTNHFMFSVGFVSTIAFALAQINRYKLSFRDDPFVFADVFSVKEALNMTGNYSLYIDKRMILGIATIIFILFIAFCFRKTKLKNFYTRMILLGVSILLLTSTYHQVYLNNTIYAGLWNPIFGSQWKSANQYSSRGMLYSFIRSFDTAFPAVPDGYKEKDAKETLSKYNNIDMKANEKVNVISIMLEAYNDLSDLPSEVPISDEPYQYFHMIQDNSYSGYLFTDIFGGGTVATERSFLTGISTLGQFRRPSNSFVRYFKEQGYYTEALHPCHGWFYNRQNINTNGLGFDKFYHQQNRYAEFTSNNDDLYHGLLKDDDFFDDIISRYEISKEQKKPYFNFSVTYQNHGPYDGTRLIGKEYVEWQDGFNESNYYMINNYLHYIHETDIALNKLYEYIQQQDEPIVLILFGDHNPYLGEGSTGFDLLGVNVDVSNAEGATNYYQTPYVITANTAAKQQLGATFTGNGNTISPLFLMDEFFEVANIKAGSPYLQYLHDLKQNLMIINPAYLKVDDKLVTKDDLSKKAEKLLKTYRYLEYYVQYDWNE